MRIMTVFNLTADDCTYILFYIMFVLNPFYFVHVDDVTTVHREESIYENTVPLSTPRNTFVKMRDIHTYINNKKSEPDAFKEEYTVCYFL